METNAGIFTKDSKTFCPFTNQSVTVAVAYSRMYDFLAEKTGMKCISCLDWSTIFFSLFNKEKIKYTVLETIKGVF